MYIYKIGLWRSMGLVWKEMHIRSNPTFGLEISQYRRCRLMACGGISLDGWMDLHIIHKGILTAYRYAEKIVRSHVETYAAAIDDSFLLMYDSSRYQSTRLLLKMLVTKNAAYRAVSMLSRHKSDRARMDRTRKTHYTIPILC